MIVSVSLLLLSAAVIYVSCEYFVNGVEWAGRRLGVAQSAVGTVLAAFGTALPESVVTFVAVIFGDSEAQKEIGVGAALGGPLVLATVAYAVVGFVFLTSKDRQTGKLLATVNTKKLSRDQSWFIAIFIFKVLLGLVAFVFKPWLGILFLLAYGTYIWGELHSQDALVRGHEKLDPLKFQPNTKNPSSGWVLFQTAGALAV